jgi:hypothetical protein
MERYKASRNPEQDIRVNDLWHASNLDLLERCAAYLKCRQYREFEALWLCYCREESNRLKDRMYLMRLHGIECLPHAHRPREHALYQECIAVLSGQKS